MKGWKISMETDWHSKITQSVQKLGFFQKIRGFRETIASFKIAKGSKFAAEFDWNNKFPQRLQKLVFSKKKIGKFSEKISFF